MEYHKNQPFSSNYLRPCPLLDNQGRLAEMVENSGAKSTDIKKPEDVRSLTEKCIPAADNWDPVADRLWQESHGCSNCHGCLAKGAECGGNKLS